MLKGFRQPSLLLMNILNLLMRLYTVNGCLEFANSGCKLGIATIAVPKSQLGILYAYLSRTLSNSAGYYFLRTTWESWRGDCNSSTCELEITKNNLNILVMNIKTLFILFAANILQTPIECRGRFSIDQDFFDEDLWYGGLPKKRKILICIFHSAIENE